MEDFFGFGDHEIYEKAVRTDLNPGKNGSAHSWSGDVPKPTQSDKFRCNFWSKVLQENRSEPVDNVLIDLAHKSASVSEQENSRENIINKLPQKETIDNELHQSVNKENLETASPSVFHFTKEQKLEEALDRGDVDEVKKYCELKEGDRLSRLAIEAARDRAVNQGKWRVVEYLCELTAEKQVDFWYISQILKKAVTANELHTVEHLWKLLIKNQPEKDITEAVTGETLAAAAAQGKLDIVKWFCSLNLEDKPNKEDIAHALRVAASEDKLDVVSYICTLNSDNKPNHKDITGALNIATARGYKDLAAYLSEYKKQLENKSLDKQAIPIKDSSLSKEDLTNGTIYLEQKGTLAARIDFAWDIYQNEENTEGERKKAFYFLVYAFDINDIEDVNGQLIQLMTERQQHKSTNPEFIPGKAPSYLPFDPKTIILKKTAYHGGTNSPGIKEAIQQKELLDVDNLSKEVDDSEGTKFFTAEERAAFRVNISKGLFEKNGELFDTSKMRSHDKKGFGSFTINANGEFSVFIHNDMEDKIAHSSMNAGSPVVAAGEIKIKAGVLQAITTHSGHYKPSLFNVSRTLEHFASNGIDISQAKVVTFEDPSKKLKGVKSKSAFYNGRMYETPALQVYRQMDKLIDENIKAINREVQSYEAGGLLSSIFHLKDKLINSNLTEQRAILAKDFQKEIALFREHLKNVPAEELSTKTEELIELITTHQEKNTKLSTDANKNKSSGRLASSYSSFKERLVELKTDSEAARANPMQNVSMKNIK